MPTGAKLWQFAYRYDGKQKLLAIGSYPVISLVGARRKRDDARKLLADGKDPSTQKKLDKVARLMANANTFNAIADDYLAKMRATTAPKLPLARWSGCWTMLDLHWDYDRSAKSRPPGNWKRQPASGRPSAQCSVTPSRQREGRSDAGIARGHCYAQGQAARRHHRSGGIRRASQGDRWFFRSTDHQGRAATCSLACLPPRELRHATWADFDLENQVWSIPAERMKMRRPHRVPLPAQAVTILKALHPVTGHGAAGLVFPGLRSAHRPISDNTMNGALRRLGYSQDEATARGFRSTFSTLANESGKWNPDASSAS